MFSISTVLVTGASGLLGTAVAAGLNRAGLRTILLCRKHLFLGMTPVDLMNRDAVLDLARLEWDAVINCAAFRSPDYCAGHPDEARVLNVEMPACLAGMAAARQAPMIHISSDYVFPGSAPPYGEDDPPAPLNVYGHTKAESEQAVRAAHRDALVVRIPALYGNPPAPVTSTLLREGLEAAFSDEPMELDDVTVRHPTAVEDVAEALMGALRQEATGLLHVSAEERCTRYEWTVRLCGWLNRDAGRLRRGPRVSGRPAVRPVDAQLAVGRLRALGLPVPRGYRAVLPGLLAKMGLPVQAEP